MRFAIVENRVTEAGQGLRGFCPGCARVVIAKCGAQRIHHWAHITSKSCDSWWESETEWHRSWKSHFPAECQEIFLPNESTGEKHIADVRTHDGLVIEFQHSHIDPQERVARESFYKNMIWVVDGTRLKRDFPRFLKGKEYFRPAGKGIYRAAFLEEWFPSGWIGSSKCVVLDFQGTQAINDMTDKPNDLYWLFPKRIGSDAILAVISRRAFVEAALNGKLSLWAQNYIDSINQVNQEEQAMTMKQQRIQDNISFERFTRAVRYRRTTRRHF